MTFSMVFNTEQVFKTEGVPDYTFVKPSNYTDIFIDFRNPKKPVILEGQSGTGKTTVALKILSELYTGNEPKVYSGRNRDDVTALRSALLSRTSPVIIIDDFHRLSDDLKEEIGESIKIFAEKDSTPVPKVIIIGINKIGTSLVQFTPDSAKRLGIHKIAKGSRSQIFELISKGEATLNLAFSDEDKEKILNEAEGDYWLTQLICQKICIQHDILSTQSSTVTLPFDVNSVRLALVDKFDERYKPFVLEFVKGTRFRQSNRGYFRLLHAVSESGKATVSFDELSGENPKIKPTLDQIKKKRLAQLIQKKNLENFFYFDSKLYTFSIEDPAVAYYVRYLTWENLRKDAGFSKEVSEFKYDVAFSFAGSSRDLVELVKTELEEQDVTCFYDRDYEHKLLGSDLEAEFEAVYSKDSHLVVAFIDEEYKTRIWPKFERSCYNSRVGSGQVIPVRLDDTIIHEISDSIGRIDFSLSSGWESKTKSLLTDKIFERLKELDSSVS
ncbi:TIR domain-containing protein [Candidatus Micrarchaeota archaeon]|nr:TIR domain-containing protein [Candidatus Micrarchaeota archaeon]